MSIAIVPPVSGTSGQLNDESLDPIVTDIGLLTGLLQEAAGEAYTLDSDWFNNPISATQEGVRQNADQLTDLLTRALGSVGGNALGVPAADPALLGTWIP